jgi:hypothetical protein
MSPAFMPNLRAFAAGLSLPDGVWIGGADMPLCRFPAARSLRSSASRAARGHGRLGCVSAVVLTPIPWLLMMSGNPAMAPLGGIAVLACTLGAAVRFFRAADDQGWAWNRP